MSGGQTEQGCRFALHPGGMAVAVERGKKVAGLAGGGVEVGGGFVARDDAESLAGTESRGCDARQSIWKKRSWAWAYPRARAASSRFPARMVTCPSASRSIVASAESVWRFAVPSSFGRLERRATNKPAEPITRRASSPRVDWRSHWRARGGLRVGGWGGVAGTPLGKPIDEGWQLIWSVGLGTVPPIQQLPFTQTGAIVTTASVLGYVGPR